MHATSDIVLDPWSASTSPSMPPLMEHSVVLLQPHTGGHTQHAEEKGSCGLSHRKNPPANAPDTESHKLLLLQEQHPSAVSPSHPGRRTGRGRRTHGGHRASFTRCGGHLARLLLTPLSPRREAGGGQEEEAGPAELRVHPVRVATRLTDRRRRDLRTSHRGETLLPRWVQLGSSRVSQTSRPTNGRSICRGLHHAESDIRSSRASRLGLSAD